MSSSYRIELDKWLRELDVNAKCVLDLGGSQLPVKGRTKSWQVETYLIGDLPEPHIGSPKPDVEIDLNRMVGAIELGGKYDLIFCLEVFDYIFDPVVAMRNIYELLAENGSAWVTFPSFYPHHQPIQDDALRYMEGGICKIANEVGLEIAEMVKRRPETDALQQFFSAERMRAAKQYDHAVTGFIVRFKK